MYYRLNKETSTKEFVDSVLQVTVDDPGWWALPEEEWMGVDQMEISTRLVTNIINKVWVANDPEKKGLEVVDAPEPNRWYLALAQVQAETANREYTTPDGDHTVIDYGGADNTVNLIGFYTMGSEFVFFDQKIGSLGIKDASDYRLLKNWS
jgi:hypothetical protein